MKTTWPEKDPEDLELIDTLLSQPLVRSLARFAGGSRPLERSSLPLTGSGGGRGAGDRSVSRESKEPAIEEKPTERSSDRTSGFTRREGGPDFAHWRDIDRILQQVGNFRTGGNWEEWIGTVVRKLPSTWSDEAKINAVTQKLEPMYQIRLDWVKKRKPHFSFSDLLTWMSGITSSGMGEINKQNQLRDSRQAQGQSFRSWVESVTALYFDLYGRYPDEPDIRKLVDLEISI